MTSAALSVDALVAEARRETGLEDFEDERFRAALAVLLQSAVDEGDLTSAALEQLRRETVELLAIRLRTDASFRRHPEIAAQPIVAPIVIVGLQRSGTSKLFRSIASDPQWNVLRTWQALYPVPISAAPGADRDPRIALTDAWVAKQKWMQAAHSFHTHAPEMEALLLRHAFMLNVPGRLLPAHQRWCESADFEPVYHYLRRMLQYLQWQTGSEPGRRWVLKTPAHLLSLPDLAKAFPDATFVMTHRDPRSSVGSMLRLVELAQERSAERVDRGRIRAQWLRILSLSLQRFVEYRDSEGDAGWVDVGFSELSDAAVTTARRIYASAGAVFSEESDAAIRGFDRGNPRNKDGTHAYRLEDYGVDEAEIEERFGEYLRRYARLF